MSWMEIFLVVTLIGFGLSLVAIAMVGLVVRVVFWLAPGERAVRSYLDPDDDNCL